MFIVSPLVIQYLVSFYYISHFVHAIAPQTTTISMISPFLHGIGAKIGMKYCRDIGELSLKQTVYSV